MSDKLGWPGELGVPLNPERLARELRDAWYGGRAAKTPTIEEGLPRWIRVAEAALNSPEVAQREREAELRMLEWAEQQCLSFAANRDNLAKVYLSMKTRESPGFRGIAIGGAIGARMLADHIRAELAQRCAEVGT